MNINKDKIYRIIAGVLAALVVVLVAFGVTHHSGKTATYTAHGTFTPTSEAASMFGGVTEYAYCSSETPAPGTQVTVKDPSGKVLGVGSLGPWSQQSTTVSGLVMYSCAMPFTITGLPKESVYGFSVNGVSGIDWETDISNVNLDVTSGVNANTAG